MSLQDVPIKNSSMKARTMFNNGSELTLVSSFFANKNNFSYEEASYTISGVGGAESMFNSRAKEGYIIFHFKKSMEILSL